VPALQPLLVSSEEVSHYMSRFKAGGMLRHRMDSLSYDTQQSISFLKRAESMPPEKIQKS